MSNLDDAIDSMSARDVEALKARLEKRLQACIICRGDGAVPVHGRRKIGGVESRLALMLCPACIERHRLPESRATDG